MSERAAVILAAGQGTRMRSPLPKVLHTVGARALLDRAIDACQALGCARIIVVAGAHAPAVAAHAANRLGPHSVAIQDPPRGTADAVRAAERHLSDFAGDLLVTYADTPLLDNEAINPLFEMRRQGADLAVLGFEAKDPGQYGRLIEEVGGDLVKIVEAKDATPRELSISICNSGVMAAPSPLLFSLLKEVKNLNAKNEFYLTDVVGLARGRNLRVRAVLAAEDRVMGVNCQRELGIAERAFQTARRLQLLDDGVSMTAPETVFFSWDTRIEPGVLIEPNVVFGPGVTVQGGAVIRSFSHLEGAVVKAGAKIGPYARLRPGAEIGEDAHIGNFVEVKKAVVGKGAKANHLAYLGDGVIGAGANIGAGTIFCNYDGFDKHQTEIGEGAFIGSNSALVAPIRIGDGAYVGSGSVITENVAPNALALGRGRQTEKPGWADAFRAMKRRRSAP